MKKNFYALRVGQLIWTEIVEVYASGQVLVNYKGDLLRVTNSTGRSFAKGDRVQLQVSSADPLEFRLYQRSDLSFERFA